MKNSKVTRFIRSCEVSAIQLTDMIHNEKKKAKKKILKARLNQVDSVLESAHSLGLTKHMDFNF